MTLETVKGKYIWIIGASSGIGKALAKNLAGRGAILALSARREETLNDVLSDLKGDDHIVLPLDVTDRKALSGAYKIIQDSFPKLDSAIFLAAIYAPHEKNSKDIEFVHKMIDVNLVGALNMVDTIMPSFKTQKSGQIILCASVAGYRGLPFGQPYCATKAAIINYAESLKIELEPDDIDVKIISPGFVKTPMTDKNDFSMPMMIEPEEAGEAIVNGLCKNAFEIHFPKKFTFIMKFVELLPRSLYFMLARKMRNRV